MTSKNKRLKKKIREKRLKKEKSFRKSIAKRALDNAGKRMMRQLEEKGFMNTIYKIWREIMLFIGDMKCVFGFHDWKLCSGLVGQPKYTCLRCSKMSTTLWEDIGSKEHYLNKHKNDDRN